MKSQGMLDAEAERDRLLREQTRSSETISKYYETQRQEYKRTGMSQAERDARYNDPGKGW